MSSEISNGCNGKKKEEQIGRPIDSIDNRQGTIHIARGFQGTDNPLPEESQSCGVVEYRRQYAQRKGSLKVGPIAIAQRLSTQEEGVMAAENAEQNVP